MWDLVHLLGRGACFIMSPLSGARFSAGAFELMVGCWSTCQMTFFIMSLLSRASISVRVLNS